MRFRNVCFLILIPVLTFKAYSQENIGHNDMKLLYFESPEKAVKIITRLLQNSDWLTLAKYYDLSEAEIEFEQLSSGEFFINKEKPEVAHPGGFWKFKSPFSPGFKYFSHESHGIDSLKVNLQIEIDQGDGMVQRGYDSFFLKKSDKGYQLLPSVEK